MGRSLTIPCINILSDRTIFVELANGNIILVGEANEQWGTTISVAYLLLCDSKGHLIDARILEMPDYTDIRVRVNSLSTVESEGSNQEVILGVVFSKTGLKGSAFLKMDNQLNLIANNSIQGLVGDVLYLDVAPNGTIYSSSTERHSQRISQSAALNSACLTHTENFGKSPLSLSESSITATYNLSTSVSSETLIPVSFTWNENVLCGTVSVDEKNLE